MVISNRIAMSVSGFHQLASFKSQARGIKFYDVSASDLDVGRTFHCQLEPSNEYDSNCVALWVDSHSMIGHLAREAANYLAPLLREGFEASG